MGRREGALDLEATSGGWKGRWLEERKADRRGMIREVQPPIPRNRSGVVLWRCSCRKKKTTTNQRQKK